MENDSILSWNALHSEVFFESHGVLVQDLAFFSRWLFQFSDNLWHFADSGTEKLLAIVHFVGVFADLAFFDVYGAEICTDCASRFSDGVWSDVHWLDLVFLIQRSVHIISHRLTHGLCRPVTSLPCIAQVGPAPTPLPLILYNFFLLLLLKNAFLFFLGFTLIGVWLLLRCSPRQCLISPRQRNLISLPGRFLFLLLLNPFHV